MFYVGAQVDNDDEMLPQSFSVFSPIIQQDTAVQIIMLKVLEDIGKLDIEDAEGKMVFQGVFTWQEWADIKIDDHVKMEALAGSICELFLDTLASSEKTRAIATAFWIPPKGD